MTFIPTTPPATDPATDAVTNLAFWPALSMSAFRVGYRVDTTVSGEEARLAIAEAARTVNGELETWRVAQTEAGYATLSAVPSPAYGDDTANQQAYRTAVYSRARALVAQDYRNYDSTKSGHDRADAMDSQADMWLARSRAAVREILGITRSTVELI